MLHINSNRDQNTSVTHEIPDIVLTKIRIQSTNENLQIMYDVNIISSNLRVEIDFSFFQEVRYPTLILNIVSILTLWFKKVFIIFYKIQTSHRIMTIIIFLGFLTMQRDFSYIRSRLWILCLEMTTFFFIEKLLNGQQNLVVISIKIRKQFSIHFSSYIQQKQ